jgi:sialidase-1
MSASPPVQKRLMKLVNATLLVALLSLGTFSALSNEPTNAVTKTGSSGKFLDVQHHLLLSPSAKNPRNSEGDFIQLTNGTIVFIYTHFTGGAGDHAKAFLASRESSDGGKSWTDKDKVVVTNEAGMNVMSVSLLRLNSGEIALFYLRKNSTGDCRPILRLSTNETVSWSDPIECLPDEKGYYVLNNSRVIQLENGRLVMPLARHADAGGKWEPGKIICLLSDDKGRSWQHSPSILDKDKDGTRVDLMEPGVVEIGNGRLFMVIRTKLGCQFSSRSEDAGQTWSVPSATEIFSPESPATVRRIPATGDLLLIWNDHSGKPESYRRSRPPIRTPLSVAISRDGGRTWQNNKIIEGDPDSGFCYTSVTFVGNRVLLGYCAHKSRWGLESTQISSFDIRELYK